MESRATNQRLESEEALEAQTLSGSLRAIPTLEILAGLSSGRFAAELLTSLGHPTRLRIVQLLRHQPMTVGQITSQLEISQANASQHLGVLLRSGALLRASDGATRRYSLRSPGIAKLLDVIEEFRQTHWEDLASELVG